MFDFLSKKNTFVLLVSQSLGMKNKNTNFPKIDYLQFEFKTNATPLLS